MLKIETWGERWGWRKGAGDWAGVKVAIAQQQPIQVIQEAGSTEWQAELPPDHPFYFGFPDYPPQPGVVIPLPRARIWISPIQRRFSAQPDFPKVQWHPSVLWVGIGCQYGAEQQSIEFAVQQACRSHHLAEAAIAGIATLERKANEPGLIELCAQRNWLLRCFTAEQLCQVSVPTPSVQIATKVDTPSVAEAAALLAAAQTATLPNLRVRKQIVRQPGSLQAVTVAIAEAELD